MKVFMITWGLFCLFIIAGLFIAYATDNFPGVPSSQQVEPDTEEDCSPCEENLKRLKEAQHRQERDRNAQEAVAVSNTDDTQ